MCVQERIPGSLRKSGAWFIPQSAQKLLDERRRRRSESSMSGSGTGNNKFTPDASITRQDMMVLTERALRMLKKLEAQGTALELDKFEDKSLVAAYAVNAIASVVKKGLIVGSGGNVNPLGNTTRAKTAVFVYRIYNK